MQALTVPASQTLTRARPLEYLCYIAAILARGVRIKFNASPHEAGLPCLDADMCIGC